MSRVYFHIGLHKTASTWLQTRLFPSLDGVRLFRTRNLGQVPLSGVETIIVSHEGLSGELRPKSPGDRSVSLERHLAQIETLASDRAFIVGFREHRSWLQSAYAQKAKKDWAISRTNYVGSFSMEDLEWCRTLGSLERSSPLVFPFLFEELAKDPKSLVRDLCRFIGKDPPENVEALLRDPVGWSPKGRVGQFVASSLYRASGPYRTRMKRRFYKFGILFDRYLPPTPMPLDRDMAVGLKRDWDTLLTLIADRRGRDFSWARLPL
jgi:hypothetical protein